MKNLSIRFKITLWFSVILIIITALTFFVIIYISGAVLQKTVKDNLIETVTNNFDEIEYFKRLDTIENDNDADHYIRYSGGYIEIDDDFLDTVNHISTALYESSSNLLYGENQLGAAADILKFKDGEIQKLNENGVTYYVYDRALSGEKLDGLWLRGIVSEEQGATQISSIAKISLFVFPIIILIAIFGGYIISGRFLKPIIRIKEAADEISEGSDLKKRIELPPGNDELHRLADTFNNMFSRLDEAFTNEQQFTSDVSHELRTPTTVINSQCEYTLEKPRTAEEYTEALATIKRQSKKMSTLIEDMLKFTRLQQKSDTYAKERLNLSKLTQDIADAMALIKEQNITLTAKTEDNVFVSGNPELLSRLISNLISNAYRYGTADGKITVTLSTEGANAVLSVSDNGIGIEKEQIEKIFNRFYQVDSSRSGKGSGLGLSMCREIAAFHGGEIKVESTKGEGSKFTFEMKKA